MLIAMIVTRIKMILQFLNFTGSMPLVQFIYIARKWIGYKDSYFMLCQALFFTQLQSDKKGCQNINCTARLVFDFQTLRT